MQSRMEISKKELIDFGFEHYTFVNQIFGDMSVREIISEEFKNPIYKFAVEKIKDGHHHILKKKINRKSVKVCSVESGIQNIKIDKNDTLCQSYSLLLYFGVNLLPLTEEMSEEELYNEKMERQIKMVEMYETIIENPKFIEKFKEICENKKNKKLWEDYTSSSSSLTKKYLMVTMDAITILQNIRIVLQKWKAFGYRYYINDGDI
jgi:hypothetical protein